MNRKLFKLIFSPDNTPDWICPTCAKGTLGIKKNCFNTEETSSSRQSQDHEAWEPDWNRYVYSCVLVCSNQKCREVVVSCGEGKLIWGVELDEHGEQQETYFKAFSPQFFTPNLNLIDLPANCPGPVALALVESFKLFFSNPGAAANNIRIAIEEMLTDMKVRRFDLVNGKRKYIPLHARIALIPNKFSPLKELIMAVKWLGNAGSHSAATVTADDVLDAYELTEHTLDQVYNQKPDTVGKLARKINRKKGPTKNRSVLL